jgi:sec-independent protein translocase protein TatA
MGVDLLTPMHLLFLGLLAVMLFGSKRLPEIGRSLGNGIREFKTTVSGLDGVTEAVNGVNEVRAAVSPTNIARKAIPGVAQVQDTIAATGGLVNPVTAEASGAGSTSTRTVTSDQSSDSPAQ